MSDWYVWFFVVTLGIACLGALGYGFFGEAKSERHITWALCFGWPMYWSTLILFLSFILYWGTTFAGYHWFGNPKPWWHFLVGAFAGLLLLSTFMWLGRLASLPFWPAKTKEDPYAQPENLGWDGHPVH